MIDKEVTEIKYSSLLEDRENMSIWVSESAGRLWVEIIDGQLSAIRYNENGSILIKNNDEDDWRVENV
jgi:hypothetical protein